MFDLTDTELAYIAGIIDGEGCILISRSVTIDEHYEIEVVNYNLRLHIVNTNLDVIEWLKNKLEEGVVSKRKPKNCLQQYTYHLSGDRVALLCEKLLPYLIIKKEQAINAIEFYRAKLNFKSRYGYGSFSRIEDDDIRNTILERLESYKLIIHKLNVRYNKPEKERKVYDSKLEKKLNRLCSFLFSTEEEYKLYIEKKQHKENHNV